MFKPSAAVVGKLVLSTALLLSCRPRPSDGEASVGAAAAGGAEVCSATVEIK